MNQRKPNIILKLSDCKIQLNFIFETILVVDLVQEWLGKRSNHRFLIIVDNILKELIDNPVFYNHTKSIFGEELLNEIKSYING